MTRDDLFKVCSAWQYGCNLSSAWQALVFAHACQGYSFLMAFLLAARMQINAGIVRDLVEACGKHCPGVGADYQQGVGDCNSWQGQAGWTGRRVLHCHIHYTQQRHMGCLLHLKG